VENLKNLEEFSHLEAQGTELTEGKRVRGLHGGNFLGKTHAKAKE